MCAPAVSNLARSSSCRPIRRTSWAKFPNSTDCKKLNMRGVSPLRKSIWCKSQAWVLSRDMWTCHKNMRHVMTDKPMNTAKQQIWHDFYYCKSTPWDPRDHESWESREHATSDITARIMKPEKQRFWYKFYNGKWKSEKTQKSHQWNHRAHSSIMTQFLQVFSRLLWKSRRTQMTHESTWKSKQRIWYDIYCSEFQK